MLSDRHLLMASSLNADKMILMIGAAVTVGVVLLGLVLLFNQSRIGKK